LKFPRLSAPTRGSRNPERFPALAGAGLFLALLLQIALPSEAALPEASGLAPRMPPLPAEAPDLNHPVILARPLFAPDRKPQASGGAQASLDGYEVLGIAISAEKATVVMRAPGGKIQRVLYGGELLGWKLASVDRRQIVFEKSGQQKTLTLRPKPAGGARPARAAQVAVQKYDDEEDDEEEE
jgi:hypothetical protein